MTRIELPNDSQVAVVYDLNDGTMVTVTKTATGFYADSEDYDMSGDAAKMTQYLTRNGARVVGYEVAN